MDEIIKENLENDALVQENEQSEVELDLLSDCCKQEDEEDDGKTVVYVRELFKDYGKLMALNGIDVTLKPGKIVGLLGPNGSGKTTLIKILAGLLTPTFGEAKICGNDIAAFSEFVKVVDTWAAKCNIEVLMTSSISEADLPADLKKYL